MFECLSAKFLPRGNQVDRRGGFPFIKLFSVYNKCFKFGMNDAQDPRKQNGSLPDGLLRIDQEGERLCQFLDPHEVLWPRSTGTRWPLFILAFDDSHLLVDNLDDAAWSMFARMCFTLRRIDKLPIFSLFLSRVGNFLNPIDDFTFLDPISEMNFDDLAFPAKENTVTLDRVVQLDWISHLGRPLYLHFPSSFESRLLLTSNRFGSIYDQLASNGNESEILLFAKQKLLDGKPTLVSGYRAESLACLSVRFSLEFYDDPISLAVARTQTERNLRLRVAATAKSKQL